VIIGTGPHMPLLPGLLPAGAERITCTDIAPGVVLVSYSTLTA
jgi:hypothetical protein